MSYPPHGGYPQPPGGYGFHPPPPQSRNSSGIGFEGLAHPPQQMHQGGYSGPTMSMPAPSPGYSHGVMPAQGYGTPPSYGMPAPPPAMSFGGVASAANAANMFRTGSYSMPVPGHDVHMNYGYAQHTAPVFQAPPSVPSYSPIVPQMAPSYQAPPPTVPTYQAPPPSAPPTHAVGAPAPVAHDQIHAVTEQFTQSPPPVAPQVKAEPSVHSPLPSHTSPSHTPPLTRPRGSTTIERTPSEKQRRTQGTVHDCSPFYPEKDAEVLRRAMKGLGCDSKAVLHIISTKSNRQRQEISRHFNALYGRDLMKDLKSELGGHFEEVIVSLMRTPPICDAHNLRKAMKGLGTDEDTLIEILCSSTNSEIRAFTQAFTDEYNRTLEKDIISETNGHFKKFLVSLLQAQREEHKPIDLDQAHQDALELYKAGEGRWGTDEATFNHIFSTRNFDQLIATFDKYKQVYECDIEDSINKEMTGELRDSMIAIVQCARNTPLYFADRLYRSLKGKNDDSTIIRIIVSRSEIDMAQIKQEFIHKYGQTLSKWIVANTKGKYKNVLLQLIGERTL